MSFISTNCHQLQNLNSVLSYLVEHVNKSGLKTVYTYTGNENTHEPIYYEETALFIRMIKTTGLALQVIEVSDSKFTPSKWDPSSSIIHLPGAPSSALDEHLGSKVNEIRQFIENKGCILGWCGGGYWLSKHVEYKTDLVTIQKTRNLALWKGTEKGPLLPYKGNPEGTIGWFHGAVSVKWSGSKAIQKVLPSKLELYILLSGGGYFEPAEDEHEHQVLAEYMEHAETPRAGVKTYVGKGIAILINPYLTHGAEYLKQGLEGYKKHFPEHKWDVIMSKLETQENALKSKICFIDLFAAFTEK